VGRVYSRKQSGFAVSIVKVGNIAEIPKAEPDWRRHIVQWQMYTTVGFGAGHRNYTGNELLRLAIVSSLASMRTNRDAATLT
jgi:hypothetical protein